MLRSFRPLVASSRAAVSHVQSISISSLTTWPAAGSAKRPSAVPPMRSVRLQGIYRHGQDAPFPVPYSTKKRPPVEQKTDRESEENIGEKKLQTRTDPPAVPRNDDLPPASEAIAKDVQSIKEALALTSVPRESYALGLGGTIPYFITSLSTVYFGWSLRQDYPTLSPLRNNFMVSHETASQWLQIIEPVQLGYGAMIISFLGAIHWGMEYMEKTPSKDRTRFRYAMGVLAPAVAWPTLYMPIHFALTGQFLAFTLLYTADSKATRLGWAPPWYSTYRFVLTFIVGSAILISLIFRAKIDDAGENMSQRIEAGMHRRGQAEEEYTEKWAKLEAEEKKKKEKEQMDKKRKKKQEKKQGTKRDGDGDGGGDRENGGKSDENRERGKDDAKESEEASYADADNKESGDDKKGDEKEDEGKGKKNEEGGKL